MIYDTNIVRSKKENKDPRIIYEMKLGEDEYSVAFHNSNGKGRYKEHSHDDLFEVYCLMSGKASLEVEGEEIDLEKRIVGAEPGQIHRFVPIPPVEAIIVTAKRL